MYISSPPARLLLSYGGAFTPVAHDQSYNHYGDCQANATVIYRLGKQVATGCAERTRQNIGPQMQNTESDQVSYSSLCKIVKNHAHGQVLPA